MAERIRVRGTTNDITADVAAEQESLAYNQGLTLEYRAAVKVTGRGRDGGEDIELDLEDDDVVEYRDAQGWVDFTTVRSLREQATVKRGARTDGAIDLVAALGADTGTRGSRDLDEVRIFGVDVPAEIRQHLDVLEALKGKLLDASTRVAARVAATAVVDWLERPVPDAETDPERRDGKPKKPGVYRIQSDLRLEKADRLDAGEAVELDADRRALVLIHGTFSNTEAAFAGLRGSSDWAEILDQYGGRAVALEHPTLSVNPAVNAVELARRLPQKGKLHLVTHSRGGLVGELLSLAAAGSLDVDRFVRNAGPIADEEKSVLRRLARELDGREVQVERFVRVACPARGTILASSRLDRSAGFLFNVVSKIPNVSPWIVTLIKSFVLAFLDQRVDPTVIPGIEAQMPTSPWIHLVNSSVREGDDQLGAVAGDVEGRRWLGWLAEKGADLFFREDHDFVVDTLSMVQGAQRRRGFYSFHHGPAVSHFQYFAEPESRRQVKAWLAYDASKGQKLPANFKQIDRDAPKLARVARSRAVDAGVPTVVVVPGFMGSTLVRSDAGGSTIVWPSAQKIADEGLGAFARSAPGSPVSLLEATYQGLIDRLAEEFRVVVFPYDWRASIGYAAGDLAAVLETELASTDERGLPLHIVAHSTGGLAARLVAGRHSDVWARLKARKGRLLLLGCPNGGTFRSLQHATGDSDLAHRLRILDPLSPVAQVARQLRSYPAVLETLPRGNEAEWWSAPWWVDCGTKWAPRQPELTEARGCLDSMGDDDAVISVAGFGRLTPTHVEYREEGFQYQGTEAGDGVVSIESAATPSATYYVEASHGELASLPEALEGYVELLHDGRTHRLATAPLRAGEGLRPIDVTLRPIPDASDRQLFPTSSDLESAALGRLETATSADRCLVVSVEVVHASLEFADFPVMVGHYTGSTIMGAEWFLDKCLGGPLTKRDLLGLYPGAPGTSISLAAEPERRPKGATIIGMGEIGLLSPANLTRSVTQGALSQAMVALEQWKARRAERGDTVDGSERSDGVETLSVGVSPVLVGTSGLGRISIESSIAAILEGILAANRLLEERGQRDEVRIDRVQFVELYEDLAVEAAHAALRVAGQLENDGDRKDQRIAVAHHLGRREGGRSGQPGPEYQAGEWRSIIVESFRTVVEPPERGGGDASATVVELDAEGAGLHSDGGVKKRYVLRRGLTFKSIGALARAEEAIHLTQRDVVEKLVSEAVNRPSIDPQSYNTLYELLLPNFLKGQARDAANLLWVLDPSATHYPWEMLAVRNQHGDVEPLSKQTGMLRRLLSEDFRVDALRATGNRALVIGDPPTPWPRLPGARQEAKAVRDRLRAAGFVVTEKIYEEDSSASRDTEVLNALFAAEYRIVHIAAHGHYDEDPERSGVAIGANSFITPLVFGQLSVVPPLVFLNCCHLAQIDHQRDDTKLEESSPLWGSFHRFAASVSQQLMQDGVRAVVAAGWAVDDDAAELFAAEFYDKMFEGYAFGDAVHLARRRIREEFPGVNTWGAYQCYGDPGFRLVPDAPHGSGDGSFVASVELRSKLQAIAQYADGVGTDDLEGAVAEVQELLETTPRDWHDGRVLYAAAQALEKLGAVEESIGLYEKALETWTADAPIEVLQRIGNLKARLAWRLASEATPDRKKIRQLFDDAERRLRQVIEIAPTPERHSLLASLYRRRAGLRIQPKTSLQEAAEQYGKAHRLAVATTGEIDPYAAVNWGVFRCLAGGPGGKHEREMVKEITALARDAVAAAKQKERTKPEFWNRVAVPDAEILLGLLKADLDRRVVKITRMYQEAFDLRSAESQRQSVRDHARFLAKALRGKGDVELAEAAARLVELLGDVAPGHDH